MKIRKIAAVLLASAVVLSMSACSKNKTADKTEGTTTTAESTTTAAGTTTAATTTTVETTTETAETTAPSDKNSSSDAESVKVYYGWGQDEDEYTAEIFCPEGAVFDEYTLETYASEGLIMMAQVDDETNEYSATSNSYWHPDAYNTEDPILSILQQLYFYGEIDDDTAAEYSNCSQKVTPLGFKWNGYDVIMVETKYTFLDYGEQTDIFVGVEYDLKYWKTETGVGGIKNLTTKGLFGFDMFYYGFDEFTQDHYAWIAGELFGVDSGRENPFTKEDETAQAPAAIEESAFLGTWCDKESDWEDTYFFDYNNNGSYTRGFEYTFTWSVDGNTLTVFYAEDDIDIFTAAIEGDTLILVDEFNYEQRFTKIAEITGDTEETETEPETESSTEETVNPYVTEIIGTWKESETGYNETFTFNADGSGHYSYLNEEGTYECGFRYEFFRSDYVDIYYDDGDVGGFLIIIDGDTMTVRNDFVWDLAYTRQ